VRGEVDVTAAERDQLAATQAGERRRQIDRRVLLRVRVADERKHLLRLEDLDGRTPARLL